MRRVTSGAILAGLASLAALSAQTAYAQASLLSERVPPLVLRTEDGAASLSPSLATQLRFTLEDREGGGGARSTEAAVDLARLRASLRLGALDDRLQGTLQLELSPRGPELIDAFVEGRLDGWARLRAGQTKLPFTRYQQQSFTGLALADWPITSRFLGAERQLGVLLQGDAGDAEGLEYAVGVFAGENRRAAHSRELPGLYGETHGNASSLSAPRAPGPLHPELAVRVTHRARGMAPSSILPAERDGTLRHAASLSLAWDTDPVRGRDLALRLAPELLLTAHGVFATAVAYGGFVRTAEEPLAPGMVGLLLEGGWRADPHLELTVRFARVAILSALRDDARAHAHDMQPADPEDSEAWHAQYDAVGQLAARQELALGVHVPLVGRQLVWQNDLTWTHSERRDGTRDDLRVRSQLQLSL